MLPFLKRNQDAASTSEPVEHKEMKTSDNEPEYDGLESAFEEICKAVESKDYKAGAAALRAAFEICDSEPHEEGPHTNEENE